MHIWLRYFINYTFLYRFLSPFLSKYKPLGSSCWTILAFFSAKISAPKLFFSSNPIFANFLYLWAPPSKIYFLWSNCLRFLLLHGFILNLRLLKCWRGRKTIGFDCRFYRFIKIVSESVENLILLDLSAIIIFVLTFVAPHLFALEITVEIVDAICLPFRISFRHIHKKLYLSVHKTIFLKFRYLKQQRIRLRTARKDL